MDVVFLSRLQFALTTSFHIIFPTLTIGLAVYLVIIEFLWLRTKSEIYYRMYRFWVKIFAIHFAVGVVSGITLEFEFGTNFARFSQAVANIMAPLLAYEGMTAFFWKPVFWESCCLDGNGFHRPFIFCPLASWHSGLPYRLFGS